MKKYAIVVGILIISFFLAAGPGFGQGVTGKIGYVDLQKCLMESKEGKKAYDALKGKSDKIKADLEKRQTELDKKREALENQGLMLSPQAKQEKELDIKREVRELKGIVASYNEELKLEENKYKEVIFNDIGEIISDYGKKNGYVLILEKTHAGILWAPDAGDLTDLIIKEYDAKGPRPKKSSK